MTCGLTFEDIINQQQHFKTSAHRQNLIRKLHGLTPQLVSDESLDADLVAKRLSASSTLVDEPPSDEEDGDSHSDKDDEPDAPTAITGWIYIFVHTIILYIILCVIFYLHSL